MVFNAVFEKVDDSDNKDDKNESQDDRDNNKNNNTFDKLSLIEYASLLIFFGLFMVATKKQKGDKYEF